MHGSSIASFRSLIISVSLRSSAASLILLMLLLIGASMIDGGWSKYDHSQAVAQLEVLIKVIQSLDAQYSAGK